MTEPMTTLSDALDAWVPRAVQRLAGAVPQQPCNLLPAQ